MKDLKYYENLPETLSEYRVELEILELLDNSQKYEVDDLLNCLYEISLRHILNYSLLNDSLISKLDSFIKKYWNVRSVENTESILGNVINFGLQDSYIYMISKGYTISNEGVKKEIADTYNEIGDSVDKKTGSE